MLEGKSFGFRNYYWNTNNPQRTGPLRLRSGKILGLLIHRDLPTSVVFVTGISSSLRPVLLWREQALLMLLTELICPSIYPSPSPFTFPSSCLSSLWLPLADTYSTRVLTLGGVMSLWLHMIDSVNEALQTVARSPRPSSSYTSPGNSFEIQWLDWKVPLAMAISHLVRSLIHKVGHLLNCSACCLRPASCSRSQFRTMSTGCPRSNAASSIFLFHSVSDAFQKFHSGQCW